MADMKKERTKRAGKERKQKKEKRNGSVKRFIGDAILMILGATLTAFATKYVYDPAGLVTGGVTGLSIIARSVGLKYFATDVPLWLGNLVFNIPIFIYAITQSGIKRVLRTGFVWLLMTAESPLPLSMR